MSDDARRAILARRAKFVAAALAGIGVACGKESATKPEVCLSVSPIHEDAGPAPCLTATVTPEPPPPDASTPPGDAAPPAPCLTPMRVDAGKARPRACLKIAPGGSE